MSSPATNPTQRKDPIRKSYFDIIETADAMSDYLAYSATALAITLLLLDKKTSPLLYECLLCLQALAVGMLFVAGHAIRLYLLPRAEDARRKDFLTNALNVSLTTTTTAGYYNNDLSTPIKRLAAQVLENSLFSKAITLEMVRTERVKLALCVSVLLLTIILKLGDFAGIAAQVVLSEQILSKWLKLEWLRARFERTYDGLFQLFQTSPTASTFTAHALDALVAYETAKATGGVILSSKVFERHNAAISAQWDGVKKALKI